jgi:hypothetical protein
MSELANIYTYFVVVHEFAGVFAGLPFHSSAHAWRAVFPAVTEGHFTLPR